MSCFLRWEWVFEDADGRNGSAGRHSRRNFNSAAGAVLSKNEAHYAGRVSHSQILEQQSEEEALSQKLQSMTDSPVEKSSRRSKRSKRDTREYQTCRALDMCSKYGDVMGALAIFDEVTREGAIKLKQHNYNVLLYLCSAAAMGIAQPGKCDTVEGGDPNLTFHEQNTNLESLPSGGGKSEERVLTQEIRHLALSRGYEIYQHMQDEGVPLNEATFTSVARLAHSKGDGDLAFEMVKKMKAENIAPKLRSYGPALYAYCKKEEVEKAFEVDAHMLSAGVQPEENELAALLKVSAEAGLGEKVYLLLHRIRTTVRELSPSTVGIIEWWFGSEAGSVAGKQSWGSLPIIEQVKVAAKAGGGGWHGLGWLGRGRWNVKRTRIDEKGTCLSCGDQLCRIDIDPQETRSFAKSVAELACQREALSNEFKKFKIWLDKRKPYDAVVDGANVGLYNQNYDKEEFSLYQVNAVVKAIQTRSATDKLPLIILHCKRTRGVASSRNAQELLQKWIEADAFYATPPGSNDDWYWLYAAVKCKCLLVTNDEMRDHLFQLLGNDFFPKWKEHHQVRFDFKRQSVQLYMPPPYSVTIQESEKGSWHVPQSGGDDIHTLRQWLCVTRPGFCKFEYNSGEVDSAGVRVEEHPFPDQLIVTQG